MNTKRNFLFVIHFLLTTMISQANWNDSLQFKVNINYYLDISDTYGGGSMITPELRIAKSWYGAGFSFGYFQSNANYVLEQYITEIDMSLQIPYNEIAIMKNSSLYLIVEPVKNRWISVELLLGMAYSKAQLIQFQGVSYQYSLADEKFNYLYKYYEYVRKDHWGFKAGIDIQLYMTKCLSINLSANIQDLNNGGTFFFVGGGFGFIL